MRKMLLNLLCLLVIISLVGCQTAAEKPVVPEKKPDQVNNNELTASERRTMASKLASVAKEVDGVQNATVIVSSIGMTNNLPPEVNDGLGNISAPNNSATNNQNNRNTSSLNNKSSIDYSGVIIMIGLDLNNTVNNNVNNANIIKKKVINKIKASDERISQVIVMPNSTIIKRINGITAGIIDGEPMPNFKNDVKDLNMKLKQQPPTF